MRLAQPGVPANGEHARHACLQKCRHENSRAGIAAPLAGPARRQTCTKSAGFIARQDAAHDSSATGAHGMACQPAPMRCGAGAGWRGGSSSAAPPASGAASGATFRVGTRRRLGDGCAGDSRRGDCHTSALAPPAPGPSLSLPGRRARRAPPDRVPARANKAAGGRGLAMQCRAWCMVSHPHQAPLACVEECAGPLPPAPPSS